MTLCCVVHAHSAVPLTSINDYPSLHLYLNTEEADCRWLSCTSSGEWTLTPNWSSLTNVTHLDLRAWWIFGQEYIKTLRDLKALSLWSRAPKPAGIRSTRPLFQDGYLTALTYLKISSNGQWVTFPAFPHTRPPLRT